MNQGRNNQEREEGSQNAAYGLRAFPNRPNNLLQIRPNLNPNYQNPVDLIRNYNRGRQQQHQQQQQQQQQQQLQHRHDLEENIYERLDTDDDDEDDGANVAISRNESHGQNNQSNADNHTYERIDDRISCSHRTHCRSCKYHARLSNEAEGFRNMSQYDQPRHIYLDYSRLTSSFYQNSLNSLGRNCFSTENIAYASTRRTTVHPFVYSCACPHRRHVDARYICHHCHNLHNRIRCQDASTSRQYVYQLMRNCRCPFCRGEYSKLSVNALRAAELFRMECCHYCRNAINCTCRNKILPDASSAIYVARYLDWINRSGQSVNNPLYATVHVGRIDRAAMSGIHGTHNANLSSVADVEPSTSYDTASNARLHDSNSTSVLRSMFAPTSVITSNAPVCPLSRGVERQHICDDSCIRNQTNSLAGVCQLLGRCERTECNHGSSRLSVHWWFVNKWLPLWNSNHMERNVDGASSVDEVSREQRESDSDEA